MSQVCSFTPVRITVQYYCTGSVGGRVGKLLMQFHNSMASTEWQGAGKAAEAHHMWSCRVTVCSQKPAAVAWYGKVGHPTLLTPLLPATHTSAQYTVVTYIVNFNIRATLLFLLLSVWKVEGSACQCKLMERGGGGVGTIPKKEKWPRGSFLNSYSICLKFFCWYCGRLLAREQKWAAIPQIANPQIGGLK